MKKNSLYVYIAAYLALFIPTTGRFVFGVTLMLELFLLVIVGTLIISLIKHLKMQNLRSVILMISLISFTILYRQIILILNSEVALTLGYLFYLPPVSIFLIYNISVDSKNSLPERLKTNSIKALFFSLTGLLIFLIRDIAGFGTFTFFGKNHRIYEKVLFDSQEPGIFSFLASIPGALVFSGILIFIHVYFNNKMKMLDNVEKQK